MAQVASDGPEVRRRSRPWAMAPLVLLMAHGCGGSEPAPPGATDAGDAAAPAPTDGGQGGPLQSCTPPPALEPDPPDASQILFSLGLFHFNLEYVIGGLEYVDDDGKTHYFAEQKDLAKGWDNERVEDWIITETLAPILGIFDRHPAWRVDIEMQAYMVEVMADRHPDVLEQLRRLSHNGQVELISFHWAAQLFLAYPREDLQRSIDRTREVFTEHCLPLSGVVFNQEGQAGEGRQQMLVDNGFQIGVFPKNLFNYVHLDAERWPLYSSRGGDLIVGPGHVDQESGVDVVWSFFDDGELRAVMDGLNPYLAPLGDMDPDRVAEYENQLLDLEEQGYKITHISDYVAQLKAQDLEQRPAPPLLDGTWQPPSTDSIHRWLGGASDLWHDDEEDNRVRTGNAEARMHVAATQVLMDHAEAGGVGIGPWRQRMSALWEALWKAQVSDGSGVNPWRGEVVYCIRQNTRVIDEAAALRDEVLGALGLGSVTVDLRYRTVSDGAGDPAPLEETGPALELMIEAPARTITTTWLDAGEATRLLLQGSAPSDCEDCDPRLVSVGFPRTADVFAYTPALIEDEVVQHPFDAFQLQNGEVYLPLSNGLIGLGGDLWVVKHTRKVHVAARIAPEDPWIRFIDETAPRDGEISWVFDVFQGSPEAALEWANDLNIHPRVHY